MVFETKRHYSGNGWSLVSGANHKAINPTKKQTHIVTPAKRNRSTGPWFT
jgi:hypothetical protein